MAAKRTTRASAKAVASSPEQVRARSGRTKKETPKKRQLVEEEAEKKAQAASKKSKKNKKVAAGKSKQVIAKAKKGATNKAKGQKQKENVATDAQALGSPVESTPLVGGPAPVDSVTKENVSPKKLFSGKSVSKSPLLSPASRRGILLPRARQTLDQRSLVSSQPTPSSSVEGSSGKRVAFQIPWDDSTKEKKRGGRVDSSNKDSSGGDDTTKETKNLFKEDSDDDSDDEQKQPEKKSKGQRVFDLATVQKRYNVVVRKKKNDSVILHYPSERIDGESVQMIREELKQEHELLSYQRKDSYNEDDAKKTVPVPFFKATWDQLTHSNRWPHGSLHDLMMKWMMSNQSIEESSFYAAPSHFYVSLRQCPDKNPKPHKGAMKAFIKANGFEKSVIQILICSNISEEEGHYSQAFIFNIGSLRAQTSTDDSPRVSNEKPFMIHMDSKHGYHDSERIAQHLYDFFNELCRDPTMVSGRFDEFDKSSMPMHSVNIPQQNDGFSCMYFSLMNSFRMYKATASHLLITTSNEIETFVEEHFDYSSADVRTFKLCTIGLVARLGLAYNKRPMSSVENTAASTAAAKSRVRPTLQSPSPPKSASSTPKKGPTSSDTRGALSPKENASIEKTVSIEDDTFWKEQSNGLILLKYSLVEPTDNLVENDLLLFLRNDSAKNVDPQELLHYRGTVSKSCLDSLAHYGSVPIPEELYCFVMYWSTRNQDFPSSKYFVMPLWWIGSVSKNKKISNGHLRMFEEVNIFQKQVIQVLIPPFNKDRDVFSVVFIANVGEPRRKHIPVGANDASPFMIHLDSTGLATDDFTKKVGNLIRRGLNTLAVSVGFTESKKQFDRNSLPMIRVSVPKQTSDDKSCSLLHVIFNSLRIYKGTSSHVFSNTDEVNSCEGFSAKHLAYDPSIVSGGFREDLHTLLLGLVDSSQTHTVEEDEQRISKLSFKNAISLNRPQSLKNSKRKKCTTAPEQPVKINGILPLPSDSSKAAKSISQTRKRHTVGVESKNVFQTKDEESRKALVLAGKGLIKAARTTHIPNPKTPCPKFAIVCLDSIRPRPRGRQSNHEEADQWTALLDVPLLLMFGLYESDLDDVLEAMMDPTGFHLQTCTNMQSWEDAHFGQKDETAAASTNCDDQATPISAKGAAQEEGEDDNQQESQEPLPSAFTPAKGFGV